MIIEILTMSFPLYGLGPSLLCGANVQALTGLGQAQVPCL